MTSAKSQARALLLAMGLCLGPRLAQGDDASLTATGSVASGYTDNILAVADTEDPNAPQVQGDLFMDLSPGLAAAYERRRSVHNLNYIFNARLMARNSEATSYTNALNYQGVIMLDALSNLRLSAGMNQGRVNGFDQNNANGIGEGDLLPRGDVEFFSYNAGAGYRRLLTQSLTFASSTGYESFIPTGAQIEGTSSNSNLSQNFRLDRTFRYHLVGVETRAVLNRQEIAEELQRSVIAGPGLVWTWNISQSFSTNSTAGLDIIGDYPGFDQLLYVPRASAALTYSHERGRASVGWARGTQTNLFGGNTTINNEYFLNLGLPLPTRRPMAVALSSSYGNGEIIDAEIGEIRGETERLSADASFGMELKRGWQLGVRLETSKQTIVDINEMGTFDSTIRQNIAMVLLQGRFPEEVAAQVPRENSDRVESSNQGIGNQGGPAGRQGQQQQQ